jgi:iron-sulfur cluster repair protein YtfE (RIC family)
MDAIGMLEKDHADAKKAMEEIASLPADAGDRKKKLFDKLKHELEVHDSIEENLFYPSVQSHAKGLNFTAKDREAHEVVEEALAELAGMPVTEGSWMATFNSMRESLLRHVKDEETNLFVKIRQGLSATQLVELGARMEAEKQRMMKAA